MLQFNNIFIHAHQNLGQYEESNCYAMGWGKKRFGEKFHQQILRDVQLPIERNDKCEKFLQTSLNDNGEYNLGPNFRLHESFNCAGYVVLLIPHKLIIIQFFSITKITKLYL